jgi:hypothetical protein
LEKRIFYQAERNQDKDKSPELENGLVPSDHLQLAGVQPIVKCANLLFHAWQVGPQLIGTHEEVA